MTILTSLKLAKSALKTEIVDIPELGDGAQVIIQEMTAARLLNWQKSIEENDSLTLERIIIACMIDENGNQCHDQSEARDISEQLSMEVLTRLFNACKTVNKSVFSDALTKKKS